jgi:hypothetical protein
MKTRQLATKLMSAILIVGVIVIGATLTGCTTTQPTLKKGAAPADTVKTRTASCNCGQLRVTVVGPDPERISLCHCFLCQTQSGSAFLIQARFPREQVTIEGESKAWTISAEEALALPYNNCSTLGATFHFCPECGSTVHYTSHVDADRIGIKIGTFKDPTFPPPKITGHLQYGHPWSKKGLEGLSLEVKQ